MSAAAQAPDQQKQGTAEMVFTRCERVMPGVRARYLPLCTELMHAPGFITVQSACSSR